MKVLSFAVLAFCVVFPALGQVPSSEEPGHVATRFSSQSTASVLSRGIIRLPQVEAPALADGVSLHIVAIKIVGSTVYDAQQLQALYGSLIGATIRLSEIYDLARAVTKKYGDDGYVLSRAIVPPQEIDPRRATVTIRVSEAYIDQVQWPPSFSRYRDLFSGYARKITAQRPANINTVMRYLLLADALPGITVHSTFVASSTNPQASTLVVTADETPVDASAQIDNRGTDARGPWEDVLSATFNNLLGQHEAVSATFASALDWHELAYGALSYRQVLSDEGLSIFSDLSYSTGAPGTAPLQAVGFASKSLDFDLGLSFPVVLARDKSLTLSALAFLSDDEGWMLGAPSSDDRLRGVRIKADGTYSDTLNGTTTANIAVSHGFEGFDSSTNSDPLLSREHGRVDFTTLAGMVSRTQKLSQGVSFVTAAEGQYAFTPLLSPEECAYGGRDFGRAFDPSELTGDSCVLLSGEARFDPDLPKLPFDQTEFYSFLDYGAVYRIAPSAGTPGSDSGASAGFGLRLAKGPFSSDVAAAKPLFGRVDQDWRFFLTAKATY